MLEIVESNPNEPTRVMIAGEGGSGKSTFCAHFNKPIFIATESGLARIKGLDGKPVKMFKGITDWDGVMNAISYLKKEKHDFDAVVIDSVTALEKFAVQKIIGRSGKTLKSIGGGYGAGADMLESLFVDFKDRIEELRMSRDMHVGLVAHTTVRTVKDPAAEEDYDEFEMALQPRVAAVLRQYVDALFFVRQAVYLRNSDEKKNGGRVVTDDSMIAYTKRDASFPAKNRYGMPKIMPFTENFMEVFMGYVKAGISDEHPEIAPEDLAATKEECDRLRGDIAVVVTHIKDGETADKISKYVESCADDLPKLKAALKRAEELKRLEEANSGT